MTSSDAAGGFAVLSRCSSGKTVVMADSGGDGVKVDLPEDLTAPGRARALARRTLSRWSLPGLLEPVTLAVSEMVANAVRHGRGPVALTLSRRRGQVRVGVHDGAPAPAAERQQPDLTAESGRGLLIVEELADDTGVREIADDGKVVWANFTTDEPGPP
jgi:anti-sigma regulatory factor (Ser/Thr protein kinase)